MPIALYSLRLASLAESAWRVNAVAKASHPGVSALGENPVARTSGHTPLLGAGRGAGVRARRRGQVLHCNTLRLISRPIGRPVSVLACCLHPLDGLTRGDDRDARMAAQRQPVALVAGGDEIGPAGDTTTASGKPGFKWEAWGQVLVRS